MSILRFFKKEKEKIHFLHIGKTGGSNLKSTFDKINSKKYDIILHPHTKKLRDIPKDQKVIFCVRDPLSRFQSGFYSRKRKGQPRYFSEWTQEERTSFENFDSPNDLGISLKGDHINYEKALFAMNNINHVKSSYWNWFENKEYLLSRVDDIFFVFRTENLDEDFRRFKEKINLRQDIKLGESEYERHSNNLNYKMSNSSITNLKKWYKEDYEFLEIIKNIL